MEHPTNPCTAYCASDLDPGPLPTIQTLSPGFRELLAENRALRDQLGELRERLAWLVGRYDHDQRVVPVEKIEALLGDDSDA